MSQFEQAIRSAVARALDLDDATSVQVGKPPKPGMGDFAVPMFPFAKTLREAPPKIAARVVEAFEPGDGLASATAAGPFVNFRVDRSQFFTSVIDAVAGEGDAYGRNDDGAGRTVVIDMASPNISKHLAFHHIRSTMLGHALQRIYQANGWRAVGFNFVGDWGTTHGMLIAAWEMWGQGTDLSEDGVTKLNELYVRFRAKAKEDPSLEEGARAWFKRLEQGDAHARQVWERFREVSLAEFDRLFDRLGVHFEAVYGESFYEDRMEPVLADLDAKGLLVVDDGATVVDLSDRKMPPCLLRKEDGATLYATRDIASAVHRMEEFDADRALYVVGKGQTLHFRQWFAVTEKAGYDFADKLRHVAFGQVRFAGRKTSTREGDVVRLGEALDRAAATIAATIEQKNPAMDAEQRAVVAEQVGKGAIVFANVFRERERDWEFDWDRLLAFEGDTGPYCQYQHARIASIVRKAGVDLAGADPSLLVTEEEWQVALAISEYPARVRRACERDEPSVIASYVLDLCRVFSSWYAQGSKDPALKVNCEDADLARARLALTQAVQQVLRNGLELLGLEAPAEM